MRDILKARKKGTVYALSPGAGGRPRAKPAAGTELRFGSGDIDFSRVRVGDKLWKTNDPELDKRLRQSFAGRRSEISAAG